MTEKEQIEIAVQALKDIADPIGKFRRELEPGYQLNGMMAVQISQDHNHLKAEAKAALRKMGKDA